MIEVTVRESVIGHLARRAVPPNPAHRTDWRPPGPGCGCGVAGLGSESCQLVVVLVAASTRRSDGCCIVTAFVSSASCHTGLDV